MSCMDRGAKIILNEKQNQEIAINNLIDPPKGNGTI